MTSLTLEECRQLVPPCEAAFQAQMAAWRFEGQPRAARRSSTDTTCPLPTPEERLWCLLTSLKPSPLQVVQGRRCGRSQRHATPWMHVLGVIRRATLRTLGDAPSRTVQALAQRIGVSEVDAAALVVPTEEPVPTAQPPVTAPRPVATSPL